MTVRAQQNWWEDDKHRLALLLFLVMRGDTLAWDDSTAEQFMHKPWKWTGEFMDMLAVNQEHTERAA